MTAELAIIIVLAVLVVALAGLLVWTLVIGSRRDRELLGELVDRTMPAPSRNVRSVPPPESPEERASRQARGEYSNEELRLAAERLAAKIGPLEGSPDEIHREIARLLRASEGEVPG